MEVRRLRAAPQIGISACNQGWTCEASTSIFLRARLLTRSAGTKTDRTADACLIGRWVWRWTVCLKFILERLFVVGRHRHEGGRHALHCGDGTRSSRVRFTTRAASGKFARSELASARSIRRHLIVEQGTIGRSASPRQPD